MKGKVNTKKPHQHQRRTVQPRVNAMRETAIRGHLKVTHCRTNRRRIYDFLLVLNSKLTSDFKFQFYQPLKTHDIITDVCPARCHGCKGQGQSLPTSMSYNNLVSHQ